MRLFDVLKTVVDWEPLCTVRTPFRHVIQRLEGDVVGCAACYPSRVLRVAKREPFPCFTASPVMGPSPKVLEFEKLGYAFEGDPVCFWVPLGEDVSQPRMTATEVESWRITRSRARDEEFELLESLIGRYGKILRIAEAPTLREFVGMRPGACFGGPNPLLPPGDMKITGTEITGMVVDEASSLPPICEAGSGISRVTFPRMPRRHWPGR